jgi:DNA polymerase-1
MQQAFREGLDLHTFSASGIFGVPFDAVTDKQRKVAKVCNFAILYGVGPMTMRRQIAAGGQQATMKDAKDAIAGWRKTYPQAAALIQQWGEDALQHGYTASAFGRKRYFSRIWAEGPGAREEAGIIRRAGANHPIQGTSADITKLAMCFIADRVASLGGSVIGQVYDEIITEVPTENAAQAAVLVRDSMREAAGLFITDIPVETDTTISTSWSEADGVSLSDYL